MNWNFVSETWKRLWCIHIVPLQANSSPKTKFEKVYLWNSLFFFVNHRDELTGRCKMKLEKLFLWFWINFIGFLDILGGNRVKLLEFGGHWTEFGGACIVQTQDSRKSIFFTWIMNKSVYERFFEEIRPSSTFTIYNQPSPEICFETEHF